MLDATVYALVDPRDGRVRYVGQTRAPLARRLAGHLCEARVSLSATPKLTWIRELVAGGHLPLIRALETVTHVHRYSAERRWRETHEGLLNLPPGPERARLSEET